MASKRLINLHFMAGQLCVWHADEVEILRREHHIVGSLIGALPGAPRQNAQLGLPLQLMPEEAAVLLQHGVARLVTMSVAKPSKLQVQAFNHQRMESIKEQKCLWQEQQAEKREHLKEIIEEGRRRKKEKKKQMQEGVSFTSVKDDREISPIMKDNDSEDIEKGNQETCPQHELVQSRIGDVKTAGANQTLPGVGNIDRKHCGLDEQAAEGEGIVRGNDETRENLGYENLDGNDHRGNEDKEIKGNKLLDEQVAETNQNTRTSRLHKGEFSIPRTKASLNGDEGKGVTEERQSTNGELQRRKSPTECASEVVLSSPHVLSECFADEENDEDGRNHEERKRRLSFEKEDSVREDGCSVQLFTAEPVDSKFILEAPPSAWHYPSTEREKLKCRVFRHFWEMGYYLTSGTKFGGDFLVYPGDPLLFHSYFIVVCIPYHKQLSPLDLISHGRLGTFVKKAVVLCSVDNRMEVVCTSLQWAGLS